MKLDVGILQGLCLSYTILLYSSYCQAQKNSLPVKIKLKMHAFERDILPCSVSSFIFWNRSSCWKARCWDEKEIETTPRTMAVTDSRMCLWSCPDYSFTYVSLFLQLSLILESIILSYIEIYPTRGICPRLNYFSTSFYNFLSQNWNIYSMDNTLYYSSQKKKNSIKLGKQKGNR